jgi:hypothetical protein
MFFSYGMRKVSTLVDRKVLVSMDIQDVNVERRRLFIEQVSNGPGMNVKTKAYIDFQLIAIIYHPE